MVFFLCGIFFSYTGSEGSERRARLRPRLLANLVMGLGTPSDANAKIIRTVGFIIRMLATITMILGVANLFGVINISWCIVFVPVWVPILFLVLIVLGTRALEVVNKFVNKD
jgi:hypothetical protein